MMKLLSVIILMTSNCFGMELVDIAYDVAVKDAGKDWDTLVAKMKSKIETWSKDNNEASVDQYLNDRLNELSGYEKDTKTLKVLVRWIAYYKVFNVTPHSALVDFDRDYSADIKQLREELKGEIYWDKLRTKILEKKAEIQNKKMQKKATENKSEEIKAVVVPLVEEKPIEKKAVIIENIGVVVKPESEEKK